MVVEKIEVLLDMANQVCSAMKFLETKGIVHKDVVGFLQEDSSLAKSYCFEAASSTPYV